jgi:hypothetical protein
MLPINIYRVCIYTNLHTYMHTYLLTYSLYLYTSCIHRAPYVFNDILINYIYKKKTYFINIYLSDCVLLFEIVESTFPQYIMSISHICMYASYCVLLFDCRISISSVCYVHMPYLYICFIPASYLEDTHYATIFLLFEILL